MRPFVDRSAGFAAGRPGAARVVAGPSRGGVQHVFMAGPMIRMTDARAHAAARATTPPLTPRPPVPGAVLARGLYFAYQMIRKTKQ